LKDRSDRFRGALLGLAAIVPEPGLGGMAIAGLGWLAALGRRRVA